MHLVRTVIVFALSTCAASLVACGGSEKPEAKAPAPTPTQEALASTPPTTPVAANANQGSVSIDDEILKACGIPADEAYFPFDSSSFVKASIKPLDDVAVCFTKGPLKGKSMKLVGHADPRGDADYNFALAQHRADTVAHYLVGAGLGAAQETTTSRGAMDATGSEESTWAKDRRVDVLLAH